LSNENSNESPGLFSLLAAPVLIFDVIAVFLFYLGWVYVYYLYYNFSVNVHALDIPLYYFFVYALPVIITNKTDYLIAFAIVLIVLVVIKALAPRLQRNHPRLREQQLSAVVITAFFLVLLVLSHAWAQEAAQVTAADMRSGNAKTIRFTFREDPTKLYPQEFIEANNTDKLKLVVQTKDRFIVFFQPESEEKVLPMGSTYVVFNSDVRLANIEIENIRKRE
jgi:hypothetical protein